MPYITKDRREYFDKLVDDLSDALLKEVYYKETSSPYPGCLNYIITTLILKSYNKMFEEESKGVGEKLSFSYSDWNEIVGMLECCKLEFYRHLIGPYEDKKINENGDV